MQITLNKKMKKTIKFYRTLWKLRNYYHNNGMYVSPDYHELGLSENDWEKWSGQGESWFHAHLLQIDDGKNRYHYKAFLTDKGQKEISFWTWFGRISPIALLLAAVTIIATVNKEKLIENIKSYTLITQSN